MKFSHCKDCELIMSVKKGFEKSKNAYAHITECRGQKVKGIVSQVILQTFTFLVVQ